MTATIIHMVKKEKFQNTGCSLEDFLAMVSGPKPGRAKRAQQNIELCHSKRGGTVKRQKKNGRNMTIMEN